MTELSLSQGRKQNTGMEKGRAVSSISIIIKQLQLMVRPVPRRSPSMVLGVDWVETFPLRASLRLIKSPFCRAGQELMVTSYSFAERAAGAPKWSSAEGEAIWPRKPGCGLVPRGGCWAGAAGRLRYFLTVLFPPPPAPLQDKMIW